MKPSRRIQIIDTGRSNCASVIAAFERAGVSTELTRDPRRVAAAEALVLPGVGTFGDALSAIRTAGLEALLRERFEQQRPTLAICVGLQVLAESSEESPGVGGLGLIPGRLERFPDSVRVPQIGWNQVRRSPASRDATPLGEAYFVNSYRLTQAPPGWQCMWSEHAGEFVAAIQKGALLGCQFHPELSADFGAELLAAWIEQAFRGGVL